MITNGMGDVPEPTLRREPPINRLFRRAQILRALLAAWYLGKPVEKLRSRYGLIVQTFVEVPLRWADATYIHFPLVYIPKFYLEHQYRLRLYERAYNSLAIWMAKALADRTKPVMTNSAWTAERVKRAYGNQRVYVVHPRLTWRSCHR